jgi:hypothetical protein
MEEEQKNQAVIDGLTRQQDRIDALYQYKLSDAFKLDTLEKVFLDLNTPIDLRAWQPGHSVKASSVAPVKVVPYIGAAPKWKPNTSKVTASVPNTEFAQNAQKYLMTLDIVHTRWLSRVLNGQLFNIFLIGTDQPEETVHGSISKAIQKVLDNTASNVDLIFEYRVIANERKEVAAMKKVYAGLKGGRVHVAENILPLSNEEFMTNFIQLYKSDDIVLRDVIRKQKNNFSSVAGRDNRDRLLMSDYVVCDNILKGKMTNVIHVSSMYHFRHLAYLLKKLGFLVKKVKPIPEVMETLPEFLQSPVLPDHLKLFTSMQGDQKLSYRLLSAGLVRTRDYDIIEGRAVYKDHQYVESGNLEILLQDINVDTILVDMNRDQERTVYINRSRNCDVYGWFGDPIITLLFKDKKFKQVWIGERSVAMYLDSQHRFNWNLLQAAYELLESDGQLFLPGLQYKVAIETVIMDDPRFALESVPEVYYLRKIAETKQVNEPEELEDGEDDYRPYRPEDDYRPEPPTEPANQYVPTVYDDDLDDLFEGGNPFK